MKAEYDPVEVIIVYPEYDGTYTDMVPQNVTLVISYFQVDNDNKRLILVNLYYDNFITPNEAQVNYTEKVYYNLTFSFLPLSHKDLTINFGFGSTFYIMLYFIVGGLAIGITIVFLLYHRIVGRPPMGKKQFASFKFMSYWKLTYSPAFYGVGLSIVPMTFGNLFITLLISGHCMSIKTPIYSCDKPGGAPDCIYTLLDNILDNSANVDPDYNLLRTGRTGTAFLVLGAYTTMVSLNIICPEKTDVVRNFLLLTSIGQNTRSI